MLVAGRHVRSRVARTSALHFAAVNATRARGLSTRIAHVQTARAAVAAVTAPAPTRPAVAHASASTAALLPLPRRGVATSAVVRAAAAGPGPAPAIASDGDGSIRQEVYVYGLATAMRALKTVSITGCVTSMCAAPALAFWGNQNVAVGGRVVISLLVAMVGSGTTAALHALMKRAIVRAALIYPAAPKDGSAPRPPRLALTTLAITGFPKTNVYDLDDLESAPAQFGYDTFRARSTGAQFFAIDAGFFRSHPLLTEFGARISTQSKGKVNTAFQAYADAQTPERSAAALAAAEAMRAAADQAAATAAASATSTDAAAPAAAATAPEPGSGSGSANAR